MNICLLRAVRSVAGVDSDPMRLQVFEDVKARSVLIRAVYSFYKACESGWISSVMVAAYGLKSYLFVAVERDTGRPILASGMYVNEIKQFALIEQYIGKSLINVARLRPSLRSLGALFQVRKIRRFLRIIERLKAHYDFMPMCRIASTMGFYSRYARELERQRVGAVLVASNYGPDSLGLRLAAKARGIPSIFVPHAGIPRLEGIPALDSNLVILDGPAAHDMYRTKGGVDAEVFYKGLPGESLAMQVPGSDDKPRIFGIFLTALTDIEVLKRTVEKILECFEVERIIIRPHPVQVVNPRFNELLPQTGVVEVRSGSSLNCDTDECDIVIAGDSSVHLEVLKRGRPTVYLSDLDQVYPDYYRFVENRITFPVDSIGDLSLNDLSEFYSDDWAERFRYFDAAYLADVGEMRGRIEKAVDRILKGA